MNKNLLFKMLATDPTDVAETIKVYLDKSSMAMAAAIKSMSDRGYEETDEQGVISADGREVIELYGRRWVLRSDLHKAKRERAAAQMPAPPDPVREGIAVVGCPQMLNGKPCGGTLNRGPVCPSCVTGKMGYRYRYTCESCGCDIVTREELK